MFRDLPKSCITIVAFRDVVLNEKRNTKETKTIGFV